MLALARFALVVALVGLTACQHLAASAPPTRLAGNTPGPRNAGVEDARLATTAAGRPAPSGPYPIPVSCALTPLSRVDGRSYAPPGWWLLGRGIEADTPIGVFYTGGNKVFWTADRWAPLRLTGERLDGPAAPVRISGGPETGGPSTVTFPAPGCWRLRAEADGQTLDATVYVYPWGLPAGEHARHPTTLAGTLQPAAAPGVVGHQRRDELAAGGRNGRRGPAPAPAPRAAVASRRPARAPYELSSAPPSAPIAGSPMPGL